jgi:hypothetical protein
LRHWFRLRARSLRPTHRTFVTHRLGDKIGPPRRLRFQVTSEQFALILLALAMIYLTPRMGRGAGRG